MTDTRVRVETSKTINLAQLDLELGGHGLVAGEEVVIAVERSPVTATQLADAIDAHTPDPNFGVDPSAARRSELADKADSGTITQAERDELLTLIARG